uniref:Mating-type protein beta1-1 n=1 Tax=Coprinopsis cinerea TaxID=5346 RepID=MAB11_COPCI|nr:RecName: Full=Mating-type protein beta1-1 [Coprinopsis cinerea]CAA44210.1 mating type protein [Coprinopsis cinerea]
MFAVFWTNLRCLGYNTFTCGVETPTTWGKVGSLDASSSTFTTYRGYPLAMAISAGTPACDSPDDNIRRAINTLRADLSALLRGESVAYSAFLSACTKFDGFAQSCHGMLSDDTLDLLYSFSESLLALSENMALLETKKEAESNKFTAEVMAILSDKTSGLDLSDDKNEPTSPTPAYVEPCARWLKDNWYNPYPSGEVRTQIARQTRTSRKDIDAWFIDARRRIGWNEVRRKHFENKRVDIVRAASIFTGPQSIPAEVDALPDHIELEFAGILSRARSLYEEKFSPSKLAVKLDTAVKDMTPSLKEQLKNDEARRKREASTVGIINQRARHAYPTPERSPASAAELLASPPSFAIDSDKLPSVGRKRRRSLESDETVSSPLCKRPRSQSVFCELSPVKGLPSPSPSTQDELLETSAAPSPQPSLLPKLTPTDSARSTGKRKRRLSDGFQYPAAKRPEIRPQVVSDPFPATSSEHWEQWFREHVLSSPELTLTGDIPPAVTTDAPDSNTPLDIQLFNFPLIPDLPPSVPVVPAPTAELNIIEPLEVPAVTQVNVDPEATALDHTFSWMASDFPPPLQSTNTFPSSSPFSALDGMSLPFPDTRSSAFLPDPSLWSNISDPDLDFSTVFSQPSTNSAMTSSIQVPLQPTWLTSRSLSEQEREAKRKELEELEARAQAIRAEISAP